MQNDDNDAQSLIERLRSEVRKRKALLDGPAVDRAANQPATGMPPPQPAFNTKPRLKSAQDGLNRAAIKNKVGRGWPSFLRLFRRNQGAVNEGFIKAMGAVIETSEWLRENVNSLSRQLDEFHRRLEGQRNLLAECENKIRQLGKDVGRQQMQLIEVRDGTSEQQQQRERRMIEIEKFVKEQEKQTAEEHQQLQAQRNLLAEVQQAIEQVRSRSAQLELQLTKLPLTPQKADLGLINDKINAVRTSVAILKAHLSKKKNKARGVLSETAAHSLTDDLKRHEADAFYLAFENQFRGDREEIKERLRVHLPFVEKAKIRTKNASVVDVGCGRGEWLELLSENKYKAVGIDTNLCMVEECRSRGLAVECMDAMAYLRDLSPETVTAITGFHIVEHLAFNQLYELFQETFRVLRKGGLAIFETPNPECIKVPTYSFYLDPTHRNPIPQELMCFVAKEAGFKHTQVERLQPYFEEGVFKGYLDYAGIFTK